eukprot:SAG22_NODE_4860_length_1149_cov_0.972381_2_plen_113_part_00
MTWFRSERTENAFIPDMFGHTGNCSGLCKMEFNQALYDDTNGVAEYAYMPQGGARTMQWWATWSNFTATATAAAEPALGLFAGFLDPIGRADCPPAAVCSVSPVGTATNLFT